MKNADIRELSNKELGARIKAEKQQLTKIMFNHVVTPLENTNTIKDTKKLIARLLTEQKRRMLEINAQ
ncbi:MAG: 50S ribosomal protein L29 [Bacteroidia bacterium]|nr:50S ribosomal protein L29 [Bacteroidia bacterium]MCC7532790.1 50S ribosomal protein L29 [Bacteroidia bacterium]MCZ2141325.1 50S ribosomal protein L29 [Bacteroidia bacterium]